MKAKPFFVLFFAAVAALGALSLYMDWTVEKIDTTLTPILSPDKKFKAVRVTFSSAGPPPYCVDTIALMLAVYPDDFAERDKGYQVFTAPCDRPEKRAVWPKIEWLADRTLQITYSPQSPGYDEAKAGKKHFDITNSVKVVFEAKAE